LTYLYQKFDFIAISIFRKNRKTLLESPQKQLRKDSKEIKSGGRKQWAEGGKWKAPGRKQQTKKEIMSRY